MFNELGFSLEQIGCLLNDNVSVSEIRGMLRLKQAEIQQRLIEDRARLIRVEMRLQELEQEKSMSNYEVILKPIKSQLVAATLRIIPNFDDCGPILASLFDRFYSHAFSHQLKEVGCGVTVYHETTLRDKDIPVEAVVPIPYKIPTSDSRIWIYELLEVETVACVVHQGSFASLGNAYCTLLEWVGKHGYQISGSTREVYLQYERDGDPAQYVTEVQIPVEKAA